MATYEELLVTIREKVAAKTKLSEEIGGLVAKANGLRDAEATRIAKEVYGIEANTYLEHSGGELAQAKSFSFSNRLSEYSFERLPENGKPGEGPILANCWVIRKGTGKVAMERGRYRGDLQKTTGVKLYPDCGVRVVTLEEITAKRSKATASEARKKLASLSEDDLAALLKKAGKL